MVIVLEDYEFISTTHRARSSNVATITTSESHKLASGDTVKISNLSGTGYNTDSAEITVTSTTSFTYTNSGADEGSTADTGGQVYHNITFPYNPRVYDDSLEKFIDIKKYSYTFSYYGLTDPIKSPRMISIAGHFSGSTKESFYKSLSKHCGESKLKKLYFSSTKFTIVIPTNCKRTQSGGRTNFIDYVANFTSPFGLLFSSTQKSGNDSSSEKNVGNVNTPIEKITGTVTSGNTVTIKTGEDDGIEFLASASGALTIYLIKLTDLGGDIKMTEYYYAVVGTTVQKLTNADVSGNMIISLPPETSLNNLFSGGSVSNITSPTFYFRDGYSSD